MPSPCPLPQAGEGTWGCSAHCLFLVRSEYTIDCGQFEMKRNKAVYCCVSDKTGVADFAFRLYELGYSIVASGATASLLKQSEIEIQEMPLSDPRILAA